MTIIDTISIIISCIAICLSLINIIYNLVWFRTCEEEKKVIEQNKEYEQASKK